jgi:uncharacterized protein
MILYLDTSALVKKYVDEPFSDLVIHHCRMAEEIATSSVAYAETLATFYRKKRETAMMDSSIRQMLDVLRKDWSRFIRIEVNDGLNGIIEEVIERHPLRGFDAVHLSSALLIHQRLPNEMVFACFDLRMAEAARQEGLSVISGD